MQRRHQKVWRKRPPRHEPGTAQRWALRWKRRLRPGYVGAGTVEFIANGMTAFLLHGDEHPPAVEHPVTEMITGLGIWWNGSCGSLREPLPPPRNSWLSCKYAIEARLYAEDPIAASFRRRPAAG